MGLIQLLQQKYRIFNNLEHKVEKVDQFKNAHYNCLYKNPVVLGQCCQVKHSAHNAS